MKTMSANLAKATLALTLAMSGAAAYAQDTGVPDTAAPGEPMPTEPTTEPAPEPMPTDPATPPADPAPAPVDEDGDGIDDITGAPVPTDTVQR